MHLALLLSVFVVATCGLIYELVAGALASYLLGDSVTQFSTVIGVYLFAMGVGSYLSRFVTKDHLATFIRVEIFVGILGGFSSTILFLVFAQGAFFPVVLYGLVFLIGMGVGLEIPLLMNILRSEMEFQELVSKVLSFDYIGALVASVSFPIFLLPHLGLVRTSLMFGILNVLVALALLVAIQRRTATHRLSKIPPVLALVALTCAFVWGDAILASAEASMYPDRVIYSSTTPYQRIVLTRTPYSLRLHLNGHLQFDSSDEYRYHEALVHVGLHAVPQKRSILVLGGGDGLAVREILKYPEVERVTLVDLDPSMTQVFRNSPSLVALNQNALNDPRVTVINQDAFVWLQHPPEQFDFIVIDLPDPTNFSIGKLYTTGFYKLLHGALTPHGAFVVQSTSPLLARKSFWCVDASVKAAGFTTQPYHTYVASFGEWGFILGSRDGIELSGVFPPKLRFLTPEYLTTLFSFPPDMARVDVEPNRLNDQTLVHLYEQEWGTYGL